MKTKKFHKLLQGLADTGVTRQQLGELAVVAPTDVFASAGIHDYAKHAES
jgi:hypothetical protein